jgi:hypothetical protein
MGHKANFPGRPSRRQGLGSHRHVSRHRPIEEKQGFSVPGSGMELFSRDGPLSRRNRPQRSRSVSANDCVVSSIPPQQGAPFGFHRLAVLFRGQVRHVRRVDDRGLHKGKRLNLAREQVRFEELDLKCSESDLLPRACRKAGAAMTETVIPGFEHKLAADQRSQVCPDPPEGERLPFSAPEAGQFR